MFNPNLPTGKINKAVVSCMITKDMEDTLNYYGINAIKLQGKMMCESSVKHHPDLYLIPYCESGFFFAKNVCSLKGELDYNFDEVVIPLQQGNILYPQDVFFNAVFLNNKLICCKKYVYPKILSYALKNDIEIINVNQGYTKCNICIVNENSVITEDCGIARALLKNNFNVLLLEKHFVKLNGHEYGFIGGASGKLSPDLLAFCGDITIHPEFDKIKAFLYKRDVQPVSLSGEELTDFGSLIPIA